MGHMVRWNYFDIYQRFGNVAVHHFGTMTMVQLMNDLQVISYYFTPSIDISPPQTLKMT